MSMSRSNSRSNLSTKGRDKDQQDPNTEESLTSWATTNLASLLGLHTDDTTGLVDYLNTMTSKPDVEEYLKSILGDTSVAATPFIITYLSRRFGEGDSRSGQQQEQGSSASWKSDPRFYSKKKNDEEEDYFGGSGKGNKGKGKSSGNNNTGSSNKESISSNTTRAPSPTKETASTNVSDNITMPMDDRPLNQKQKRTRAKKAGLSIQEFEKLQNMEPDATGVIQKIAPNRFSCYCLGKLFSIQFNYFKNALLTHLYHSATKHPLLTNCLRCGKVICELEGPGPCTFCGNLVESKEQQLHLIQSGAMNQPTASAQKAIEHKLKLLDYDRNSVARTKVHDLAADFDYASSFTNRWLSPEEKALLLKQHRQQQKQKEEEERNRRTVVSIDLVNRTVVEERANGDKENGEEERVSVEDILAKARAEQKSKSNGSGSSIRQPTVSHANASDNTKDAGSSGYYRNPNLKQPAPKYVALSEQPASQRNSEAGNISNKKIPIQRRKKLEAQGLLKKEEESNRPQNGEDKKEFESSTDTSRGSNTNNLNTSQFKKTLQRLQNDLSRTVEKARERGARRGRGGRNGGGREDMDDILMGGNWEFEYNSASMYGDGEHTERAGGFSTSLTTDDYGYDEDGEDGRY